MGEVSQKQPMYKSGHDYVNIVIIGADWKPHCEKHGAMLKVTPNPSCLYRCPECGIGVDLTNTTEFIKWNLGRSR